MSTFIITIEGHSFTVQLKSRIGSTLVFAIDGNEYQVDVTASQTPSDTSPQKLKTTPSTRAQRPSSSSDLRAPMPGIISEIKATPGASVKAGDILFVIEAMKMENPIKAPCDAVIDQIVVKQGQEVASGAVLVTWQST